jgi:hypothetical protein
MSRYPATRKAGPLVNNSTAPASEKQVDWIERMRAQLGLCPLEEFLAGEVLQSRTASVFIDDLKAQIAKMPAPVRTAPATVAPVAPVAPAAPADDEAVTEPGMYRRAADGVIFRVKFNKQKTRIYAERVITTADTDYDGAPILHADGRQSFTTTFEYSYKHLGTLRASDRMTLEEATEYGAAFANCMVCGRHLRNKKSVELGIGPVCRGGI